MSLQVLEHQYLLPHDAELRLNEVTDVRTGGQVLTLENEEFADFVEREAKLLRATDEMYIFNVTGREKTKSTLGALGPFKEPLPLVKADRIGGKARLFCHRSDLKTTFHWYETKPGEEVGAAWGQGRGS